jgi:hypothetical protein
MRAECIVLAQGYKEICDTHPEWKDLVPCKDVAEGYNLLSSFLAGIKADVDDNTKVIEKRVKIEIDDDDKHKDWKHHRGGNDPCNYHGLDVCDSNGDCDSERFDCLSDCKDGSSATTGQCPHDDRHRDRDDDDRNADREHDEDEEDEEEEEEEESDEEEDDDNGENAPPIEMFD